MCSPFPSQFQVFFQALSKSLPSPFTRMVVRISPYRIAIDALTDFEGIEQRVQFRMGGKVYDIDWDSTNERVICYGSEQEWWEIRYDNVLASEIVLLDVLRALNCTAFPILTFPLNNEYTIDNYLVTPISTSFIIQMDIPEDATEDIPEAATEDEDPTSSEEECNEGDNNSDDPSSSEEEV